MAASDETLEMRRLRRAKIVATLGPASSDAGMIARLFAAGADVFRVNMSHTSQDRMRELVAMIRGVEQAASRPIGILVDLQGPKLRLGTFSGGAVVYAEHFRGSRAPLRIGAVADGLPRSAESRPEIRRRRVAHRSQPPVGPQAGYCRPDFAVHGFAVRGR